MTLEEVRQTYPEYKDVSDKDLSDALYNKFYSDTDRSEFNKAVGYTPVDNEVTLEKIEVTAPKEEPSALDTIESEVKGRYGALKSNVNKILDTLHEENKPSTAPLSAQEKYNRAKIQYDKGLRSKEYMDKLAFEVKKEQFLANKAERAKRAAAQLEFQQLNPIEQVDRTIGLGMVDKSMKGAVGGIAGLAGLATLHPKTAEAISEAIAPKDTFAKAYPEQQLANEVMFDPSNIIFAEAKAASKVFSPTEINTMTPAEKITKVNYALQNKVITEQEAKQIINVDKKVTQQIETNRKQSIADALGVDVSAVKDKQGSYEVPKVALTAGAKSAVIEKNKKKREVTEATGGSFSGIIEDTVSYANNPLNKTYNWSDKPHIWDKVNEHLEQAGEAPLEVTTQKPLNARAEQMKQAAEIPVGGSEDEAKAKVKSLMTPELDSQYKNMTAAQRKELEAEHERAMQYGPIDEHGNPLDDEGNSLFAKKAFRSALQDAIDKMPNKMDTAAFIKYLKNNGVKDDEINFSGIKEALNGPSVTKQEVQDSFATPHLNKTVLAGYEFKYNSVDDYMKAIQKAERSKDWDAAESLTNEMENFELGRGGLSETKFDKYKTQDVGTNYREVLTTLNPPRQDKFIVKNADTGETISRHNTSAEARKAQEEMGGYPYITGWDTEVKADYKSSHWDQPNVLYHTRLQDTKIDGDHTLLVDEIQSDWHQEGRSKGYVLPQKEIDEKLPPLREELSNLKAAYFEDGRNRDLLNRINEVQQQIWDLEKNREKAIPQAPYSKTWHEKAMKDIIDEAVNNGYDRVAWTVGKTQADRYSLAKQVDYINVTPQPGSKNKTVYVMLKNNEDGIMKIDENGKIIDGSHKGRTIDEVLGKEMADKIMGIEEQTVFKGAGLEVGGEGMKGFYDKILPDFTSKYIKKYGSQLEKKTLSNGDEVWSFKVTDQMRKDIEEKGQTLYNKSNKPSVESTKVEGKSKAYKEVEKSVKKLTGQSPEKVKDKIIIVEKESELPERIQKDIERSNSSGEVSGVYHHPNGKVYVIASLAGRDGARNAELTILHELTHRAFMRDMIDERIMDRIYKLAEEDPLVQEAQRRVRNAETDPEHVDQETLAYLMEAYHEGHIKSGKLKEIIEDVIHAFKRAVAKAKVFLGKTTSDKLIEEMTSEDIANYLRSVAKKEAKSRKTPPMRKAIYGEEGATLMKKSSKQAQPTGGKYEPTTKDKLIEAVQDYWRPVEVLTKGIDAGELVNNARKNIFGRVEYRINKVRTQQEKIIKNITEYAKASKQAVEQVRKDLNSFMIAQHAGERNAALGEKAAGISTKDAQTALSTLKKSDPKRYAMYVALARQVREMNKQTLDILLDGQVITKELYDNLRSKYKLHVPLNRILEDEEVTAGMMGGKGFNVKSTGLKRAKGSELEVSDIIGNVTANVQEAIIRAEKNRVGLEMYKMFNTPAGTALGRTRGLKAVDKSINGNLIMETPTDDMIVLYVDGKKKVIIPNDPIIAKVYNMMNVEDRGRMATLLGPITSTIGGLYTRFNPEFALSNIIRDIQEAFVYNVTKLGAKGATKALSKEAVAMNAVKDWIIGKDSAGARLYEDMMAHGGTTGGLTIANKTKVTEDVEDMFKLAQSKPRQAIRGIFKSIDNFNRVFEDSTRLAAYKQALEQGMTKDQAAVIAKETTIDFNRKGTATPWVNALYMFSNASVQGSAKMLRAMKDPKVLAGVTGTMTALSFFVDSHNDMVDPDWRNKTSEQERQSNYVWVVKGEDGKFSRVLIPIGWGFKPIKAMIESMRDVAYGKQTENPLLTISKAVIGGYNPIGGNDLFSAITPTVLDVASDVYRDKNWKGESINPKGSEFAQPSEKYFPQTPETLGGRIAIKVAQGTEQIGLELTPEDYKYIVKSYGGGPVNFSTGLMALIEKASKGEKSAPEDRVFLRRFYKETDPERLAKYEAKVGATKAIKHIASGETREEKLAILKDEMAKASPDEKKKIYYAVKYGNLIPKGKTAKRLEERKQWEENVMNPFQSQLTR